jgi:hypothetical protein
MGLANNRVQRICWYAPLFELTLSRSFFPFRELVLPPNR